MEFTIAMAYIYKALIWIVGVAVICIGVYFFQKSRGKTGEFAAKYNGGEVTAKNVPMGILLMIGGGVIILAGLAFAPKIEYEAEKDGMKVHWNIQQNGDENDE